MRPGNLSERVTIEQQTTVSDGAGGRSRAWSALATVWADVRPKAGRERAQAAGLEAPATYEFTLRRRADLTESMRLVWRGVAFNIRFIALPPGAAQYMTLDAERSVAG